MKNKKSCTFLTLLVIALLAGSCIIGIKGSGRVVKNERIAETFESIVVSAGLEVILSQDSILKIIVEADDNLQEIIKTEVSNGKLKIFPEERIKSAAAKRIYVTFKDINSLKASSGSEIKSDRELRLSALQLSASSGARVELDLAVIKLMVEGSSGGDITLSGSAESLDIDGSSGAVIKASDLPGKTCNAGASSGANLKIFVSEKINAKVSSGGNIKVSGNPKERNVEKSSGGNLSFN